MAVIGADLGGTKLASALFYPDGTLEGKRVVPLGDRTGKAVGRLVIEELQRLIEDRAGDVTSIGVSVPGISYAEAGTVWAPNICGWESYPLRGEIISALPSRDIAVTIESDRACYILGETWQGAAAGCKHAIFIAVGTGIGAGIMIDGEILRGSSDIAGCAGWMALDRPYVPEYKSCGCFEYHASGEGIARTARRLVADDPTYQGVLRKKNITDITSPDVFHAYETGDSIAIEVLDGCIEFWGMAVANLVSLFNPEMVVFGGGVFGPAGQFLERITAEAVKWAQPIGIQQVSVRVSLLGDDAGLTGAGRLALLNEAKNE